ncbi:MAG: TPR repeat protein [Myxococcota bacterium]|jgi:TPR repeat protein
MWIFISVAVAQSLCGPPDACFAEGVRLQTEQGAHTEAAAAYDDACSAGHAMACTNLASMLERGIGAPANLPRAAGLYAKACEAELGIPCAALGVLHSNGAGVPQDDARAVELYQRACELGHAPGCTLVGLAYDGGFGVDRSWERAVVEYRKGCTYGDAEGCTKLGARLAATRRTDHGPDVVKLFTTACDLGEGDGCLKAAVILDEGQMVPRDKAAAKAMCMRACELDTPAPCCAKSR